MVEDTILLPVLVAIIGAVSAVFTAYIKTKGIAVTVKTTNERITVLETKVEVFWKFLEENIAKILHSPHTPEIDALLDKLIDGKDIQKEEMIKLKNLLEDDLAKNIGQKRDAVAMAILIARLEQRLAVEELNEHS